jgi:hypothetical protein
MKNPNNNPLRIRYNSNQISTRRRNSNTYPITLAILALAQSNLVRQGKDSGMTHFIAIIKELEDYFGITFEQIKNI